MTQVSNPCDARYRSWDKNVYSSGSKVKEKGARGLAARAVT